MQALAKYDGLVVGRFHFQRRGNLDLHPASCSCYLDIQTQPQSQDFGLINHGGGHFEWLGRYIPRLWSWTFYVFEELRPNQSQYHIMYSLFSP
jgi:hypothetical protein